MKLRMLLILLFLLGVGLFARSQDNKKGQSKPVIENGPDAIPVTVKSTKKAHPKAPAPPMLGKDQRPLVPKVLKQAVRPAPPPLPAKPIKTKAALPVKPDAPPAPPERT
jgi:hypothetical protein